MLKNSLPDLPEESGVYIFSDSESVIYVGKANNLKRRILSYFDLHLEQKTQKMINQATGLKFIKVNNELEALLLEAKLIKKHLPKYNIIAKDDKHPLYIVITDDKFPRIITCRKLETVTGKWSYGPFPSTRNIFFVLKMIRRIFPFSDHKIGKRACLYSHIGLCNPCPNTAINNYQFIIYKQNIKNIKRILDGKINILKSELVKDMRMHAKHESYETAQEIKEKLEKLEYITRPRLPIENYLENPNLYEDQRKKEIKDLKNLLVNCKLNIVNLHRIECFDVAHLSGSSATASMVVLIDGTAEKSEYRHFRIKQSKRQSDYDSMEEIARRRLKNFSNWGIPDLIIVDGSLGQINKFKKIIKGITIVGIAKDPDRLIISSEIKIKLTGAPLQLVTRIRDEAHRFARRYHHKLLLKRENLI